MKKLLLILLCLPMIGSGQVKNPKSKKSLKAIDFGFELADSKKRFSYYVHYAEPKLIGWSKEGDIAYSYDSPIDHGATELAESIVIRSMITNKVIASSYILHSDDNRNDKTREFLAKYKIDNSGLGELNKSAYVDDLKIVLDDEVLSVQGKWVSSFYWCQKNILLDSESEYIYFSGYFKSPYDNIIAIALINFHSIEEEDYFDVNFYGCDLNIKTFDCE